MEVLKNLLKEEWFIGSILSIFSWLFLPSLKEMGKKLKKDTIKAEEKIKGYIPDELEPLLEKVTAKVWQNLIAGFNGVETDTDTKAFVENVSEKLRNKVAENIVDTSKEKLKDEVLKVAVPLLDNVKQEIKSANVLGNDFYTDNYQVEGIIEKHKELLKKDVEGYVTGYAEAQFDAKGFAQGIVGITGTKTIG